MPHFLLDISPHLIQSVIPFERTMGNAGPVTEVVQMSLSGAWEDFKPLFDTKFSKALASAPGFICVRTGESLLHIVAQSGHVLMVAPQAQNIPAQGNC